MNPLDFSAAEFLGTQLHTAQTWGAKPIELTVDVVIVGSGPGGLTTAAILAEAGHSVVILEAGKFWPRGSFKRRQSFALKNLYQDQGTRLMQGTAFIPLASGEGVGGGTLVNSGISFRAPDHILDGWMETRGLDFWSQRDALFSEVEKMIGVAPTVPAIAGMNSVVARRGFEKMAGVRHDYMPRNTPACGGCGTCQTGCPTGAKASSDLNWLPRALRKGVRLFADVRVNELVVEGKVAKAVRGVMTHPETKATQPVVVHADKIILAAGAVNTAVMLLKQGLANSSGQVGRNLHVHPGCGAVAKFSEEIRVWSGASQGYYAHHPTDPDILGETFSAPPEAFFAQVGAAGQESAAFLREVKHLASCGFLVKDDTAGVITWKDGLNISYNIIDADHQKFIRGLRFVTEMFFLSGSKLVRPLVSGGRFFNNWDEANRWIGSVDVGDLMLYASHPMGTCIIGADPKNSVVSPTGETHDIERLYITDSSLHPSALGVNPQMTIMAQSLALARQIAKA